ncbi:TIGR04255 family protein [Geodermatophilus obscurus]|uniref:TIGR04255 family protein n=1 Tax=Geodermatophilus obscurus TaxID=1861 RepID=UPI0009F99948|nr:TIGR04255 family protein [Geodermatophilus obscurus]
MGCPLSRGACRARVTTRVANRGADLPGQEDHLTTEPEAGLRRRRYANPPVAEALVRLHWDDSIVWKATTPGLIFGLIGDLYPDEPQTRNVVEAQVSGEHGSAPNFELRSGPQQMMFSRESGSRLVLVGPNDVSVHGLPPYEGWGSLEARLFEAVERLREWATPPSKRYSTIGLRYINRVEIFEPSVNFEDWLTVAFALPPGLPQTMTGFLDRIDSVYPDGATRIGFTWASTEAPAGSSAFVLDFDLTRVDQSGFTLDEARDVIADLKVKEGQAFEGMLKDSLREVFGEL